MSFAGVQPSYVRPANLTYAVDEWPPYVRLLFLGLQYAILDAIYLVLVAIIVRHSGASGADKVNLMGIACAALAIGTTLQALPRGPVGSGFLAPPVYSATYLAPSVLAAQIGGMSLVYGMTIFAGLMEVLIAISLHRLRLVVTPVISGLTVFVIGLQLGIVGIGEVLDVQHEGLPAFPLHLLVTTLTLAVCVALSIWGRGPWKLLCSMFGLAIGMLAATVLHLISADHLKAVAEAAWIAAPEPAFGDYGFSLQLLPAFLAAGAAAAFRAVGVVTTCQRVNNAAWRQPDMNNVRKGVLADGLANVGGGMLGAPGMSIAPSLVGISSVTGATSRAIAFVASGVLVVLAFSPKLAGSFLLVPSEVAGSMLVFTASFMIAGGMQIMLARPVDTRAIYVVGISTLLALSEHVFPGYFTHLPEAVHTITASPLAFGLVAALALTLLFRLGTRQRDSLAWEGTQRSAPEVMAFLRRKAQEWKVSQQVADRSAHDMHDILTFLGNNRLESGVLNLTFNGAEFRVEVTYAGWQEARLSEASPTPAPLHHHLETEESAAYAGLCDFLSSLAADRKRVKRNHDQISATLSYEG
jgi:NCS2 family nucleobase:cation symporter-2